MGCLSAKGAKPDPLDEFFAEAGPPIEVIGKDASGNTISTVGVPTWSFVEDLKEALLEKAALSPEDFHIEIEYEGTLLDNADQIKDVLPCKEPASPAVVLVTTTPSPSIIPHGVEELKKRPQGPGGMWSGIAESGGRLFMAPHHADSVLVVDPATGTTSLIPTGVQGHSKWSGIAALAGRLYCAPYNAGVVLVIDPATNTTSTIPCSHQYEGHKIQCKWSGAIASGGRIYCPPSGWNIHDILVIDPSTDTCSTIASHRTRRTRFAGLAECGGLLLSAPVDTSREGDGAGHELLLIDPATQTARTIPVRGLPDNVKWGGVAAFGGRLLSVSYRHIVAIDPSTGEATTIVELKAGKGDHWRGVTECCGRFYCPPLENRDALVIDPVAGTTSKIQCGRKCGFGSTLWGDAMSFGGRVYCTPVYASGVLMITPPAASGASG